MEEGGRTGGDAAGLGGGPRAPWNSRLGWITLGLSFLVNCFQRFSPVLFLEKDLSWGASCIFQVQAGTLVKAEAAAPPPAPLPQLPGNCSSSARKEGRCGAPANHHSQEALRRRSALARLPVATAAVQGPGFRSSSQGDYFCLFLAPGDDAVLPYWLCIGGGGLGGRGFCERDTWKRAVGSVRGLQPRAVGRFVGECPLSLRVWGPPRVGESRRAQTLPGYVALTSPPPIPLPSLGLSWWLPCPDSPEPCELSPHL